MSQNYANIIFYISAGGETLLLSRSDFIMAYSLGESRGDSLKYKVIRDLYSVLVEGIKGDSLRLVDVAFTRRLITQVNRDSLHHQEQYDRASSFMAKLHGRMKIDESTFDVFVAILDDEFPSLEFLSRMIRARLNEASLEEQGRQQRKGSTISSEADSAFYEEQLTTDSESFLAEGDSTEGGCNSPGDLDQASGSSLLPSSRLGAISEDERENAESGTGSERECDSSDRLSITATPIQRNSFSADSIQDHFEPAAISAPTRSCDCQACMSGLSCVTVPGYPTPQPGTNEFQFGSFDDDMPTAELVTAQPSDDGPCAISTLGVRNSVLRQVSLGVYTVKTPSSLGLTPSGCQSNKSSMPVSQDTTPSSLDGVIEVVQAAKVEIATLKENLLASQEREARLQQTLEAVMRDKEQLEAHILECTDKITHLDKNKSAEIEELKSEVKFQQEEVDTYKQKVASKEKECIMLMQKRDEDVCILSDQKQAIMQDSLRLQSEYDTFIERLQGELYDAETRKDKTEHDLLRVEADYSTKLLQSEQDRHELERCLWEMERRERQMHEELLHEREKIANLRADRAEEKVLELESHVKRNSMHGKRSNSEELERTVVELSKQIAHLMRIKSLPSFLPCSSETEDPIDIN